jgi:hypothetical protein
MGFIGRRKTRGALKEPPEKLDKDTWRMRPLASLPKPKWSTTQKMGMITLRGYLVVTVLVLIVKVVSLALGG